MARALAASAIERSMRGAVKTREKTSNPDESVPNQLIGSVWVPVIDAQSRPGTSARAGGGMLGMKELSVGLCGTTYSPKAARNSAPPAKNTANQNNQGFVRLRPSLIGMSSGIGGTWVM